MVSEFQLRSTKSSINYRSLAQVATSSGLDHLKTAYYTIFMDRDQLYRYFANPLRYADRQYSPNRPSKYHKHHKGGE
jgi:hypothetical protein